MSRCPEVQTHPRTHHLAHLTPRRRERGSADARYLRRAGGTAPLLSTKSGREGEERFNPPVESILHRLMQLGRFRMWNQINPMSDPKQAGLHAQQHTG